MVFKNFSIQIILRVMLILLLSLLLAWAWQTPQTIYIRLVLSILLILITFNLIKFQQRFNQQIERFFISLRDSNSHFSLSENGQSGSQIRITQLLNESFKLLKEERLEKEKQFRFLEYFLEQGGYTFLVINKQEITLSSQATATLFNLPYPFSYQMLQKEEPAFIKLLNELAPGISASYTTSSKSRRDLLVKSNHFTLDEEPQTLVLVDDISREKVKTELQSWEQLLRVIHHEVMNSLTPVLNLTQISKNIITNDPDPSSSHPKIQQQLLGNLDLIEERFKGVVNFLSGYKAVRDIPEPHPREVDIRELVLRSTQLMSNAFNEQGISLEIQADPQHMKVMADVSLIEQVLINLLRNAIEAVQKSEKKKISIEFAHHQNRIYTSVTDTGTGIPDELIDKIFLPFFTTREKGSGIGLALCRRIIHLHQGQLTLDPTVDQGARFTFDLAAGGITSMQ